MKKVESASFDDFGTLFGTNADLAALALAAYAIIVAVRSTPGLVPDELIRHLRVPEGFFAFATVVLLIGPWFMLLERTRLKEVQLFDLFFRSYYTSTFWGIILILIGFLFLVSSGIP